MFSHFYGIQFSINNYFQYFPQEPFHNRLGIHFAAIGHTTIKPNSEYPPGNHPIGRAFSWERGRVLNELQIVAIREGRGEIEWMLEKQIIEKGSVLILKPGEWHRYRPDHQTGWIEDWFEIRGHLVDYWLEQGFFKERFVALHETSRYFSFIDELHLAFSNRDFMHDGLAESKAVALVTDIVSASPAGANTVTKLGERELIAKARMLLSEGLEVSSVAQRLSVSYLALYRSFKGITGLSPKQYAESARLSKAESLLAGDQLSIKEIAAKLDFHSASHFSLAFKRCYGVAPANWRKKYKAF